MLNTFKKPIRIIYSRLMLRTTHMLRFHYIIASVLWPRTSMLQHFQKLNSGLPRVHCSFSTSLPYVTRNHYMVREKLHVHAAFCLHLLFIVANGLNSSSQVIGLLCQMCQHLSRNIYDSDSHHPECQMEYPPNPQCFKSKKTESS